jgi:hypothetical protein
MLLDRFLRPNIGSKFSISKRIPDPPLPASSNSLSSPPRSESIGHDGTSQGTKFSTLARNIGEVKTTDTPGPGAYAIPSFIDEAKKKKKGCLFAPLALDVPVEYTPDKPNKFQSMRASELSDTFIFGYGCNMQEHIMYGYCLDGKCGQRAHFEKLMIDVNDKKRIVGDRLLADKIELVKELNELQLNIDVARKSSVSEFSDELVTADNTASLTPLHIAAHKGDLDTIKKLSSLELNCNAKDSTYGRTALHFATIRNNQEAVQLMADVFSGRIMIDLQDNDGDTALHIAVRAGVESLVEILCDAGASPLCCQNKAGKWTTDLTRTHRTYQILHLTDERIKAEKELHKLHRQRTSSSSKYDTFDNEILHEDQKLYGKELNFIESFVQRKDIKPKFGDLKPQQLWAVRPTRSKVETLQEQLAKVDDVSKRSSL